MPALAGIPKLVDVEGSYRCVKGFWQGLPEASVAGVPGPPLAPQSYTPMLLVAAEVERSSTFKGKYIVSDLEVSSESMPVRCPCPFPGGKGVSFMFGVNTFPGVPSLCTTSHLSLQYAIFTPS